MKLINIASPGNKTTVDYGKDLPNAYTDKPKKDKKGHSVKKGVYGTGGLGGHLGLGNTDNSGGDSGGGDGGAGGGGE